MNPLKTLWHKLSGINEAMVPLNAFTDDANYQITGYKAFVTRRDKHKAWIFQALSEDQGAAGKPVLMLLPAPLRIMEFNAKGRPIIPTRLSPKDIKSIENH